MRGSCPGRVLLLVGLLTTTSPVLAREGAAYHFALAKMYAGEGEYPQAIQAFRAAIELEPRDPYIRLEYADFLSRTGRSRQAADEAENALALDVENLDSLRVVGQIRLELAPRDPRSLQIAKDAFERLRELAPSDTPSMLTLARLYLSENEPAVAVEILEEAGAYAPNHPTIHRMLVEALVRSGSEERAREILPRILARDPGFLEGRLALARILTDAGDRDGAIQLLRGAPQEEARDADTKYLLASELYRRAAAGRGNRAAELEDLEEASRLVQSILGGEPTHLRAQYLRALVLAEQSKRAEAISELRKLHEVAPQELRVQVTTELAELLEQEGRVSEAATLLSEMAEGLRTASGTALSADRVWLEVARLHGRHRDWRALHQASERLLASSDEHLRHEGLLLAAEALQQLQRSKEALQLLRRGEAQFAEPLRIQLKRAEILLANGEKGEADKVLGKLGDSADVPTLLALAQFHLEREDAARIIPVLRRLLAAEEGAVEEGMRREIVFLLADSLARTGREHDALRLLQSEEGRFADASELDRQRLQLEQAEVLEALGRYQEARQILDRLAASNDRQAALLLVQHYQTRSNYEAMLPVLERAIATDRGAGDVDLVFSLAVANERLGRYAAAEAAFREVLALDPDDGRTLNYLGYMWADRGENLEQALELIQRAVALEPDNGAYVDSLGWVYYRLGRLSEARHHLEEAARLLPEDATILEHLGDLYVALDIPEKARELYRRALAMDDENVEGLRRKLARLETGDS
ncbi:MAG TPA: tetratricopeptide repeat protein [Thermoanaerobaculia bacterium]|nr:tetratricopeptide repeat protein [Thermoanaerobaculia bacterium]